MRKKKSKKPETDKTAQASPKESQCTEDQLLTSPSTSDIHVEDDDEDWGDPPSTPALKTVGTVANVATTTIEDSDEEQNPDEEEDWGDLADNSLDDEVESDAVQNLLATSLQYVNEVQRVTTLEDAKQVAKSLHSCLLRLAEALHF